MNVKVSLAHTVHYYQPLLHRYAVRLTNDPGLAARLVQQVLEDQYEIDRLLPSQNLRAILKTDLLNRCRYQKLSAIFDRPPVYPLKYINRINN